MKKIHLSQILKKSFFGSLLFFTTISLGAKVSAFGEATAIISYPIALQQATTKAHFDAARSCRDIGYNNGVSVIASTIIQNGQYYNRLWHAFFGADFLCNEKVTGGDTPVIKSPLSNSLGSRDGRQNYYLIKGKVSWYQAKNTCTKYGLRLPAWYELSLNFDYLRGQAVNGASVDYLLQYYMCGMSCYNYVWVSNESSLNGEITDWAYYLTAAHPGAMDGQPVQKSMGYSAFCVK